MGKGAGFEGGNKEGVISNTGLEIRGNVTVADGGHIYGPYFFTGDRHTFIKIGDRNDFRWMATTGKGLGRYLGLNTANGAVLNSEGELEAIDSTGIFGSYRHFWSDQWRSNLTLGYLKVDNDVELTGSGVTRDAKSFHINLIYSPVPKMDFGIEYMLANRKVESGADGDLHRVQLSGKYAF